MPQLDTFDIDVAASVIADISAGIYRTPAGAIKELISNAFDADARTVRISTNWPEFRTITCSDDGSGMTPEVFRKNMGLIGGSSKREGGEQSPLLHRPLIGRIGIGILSIGQICRRFQVFSSAQGSRQKFRATIDLEPYMRPEAKRVHLGATVGTDATVKIGSCSIETADEDADRSYTRIVMESILVPFRQRLRDEPMAAAAMTPKRFVTGDMTHFLKSVSKSTIAEHGAYASLIWELAAAAPVRYLPGGPVRGTGEISDLVRRLEEFDFHVFLDGVELLKPVLLPTPTTVNHKVYPNLDFSRRLSDGRNLRVRGYLCWQKTRIRPRELQGVLVRVRNVAINGYDPNFLGYPRHEGWKFSQLSGELYVDEGLDEAVNIDRASFRETDEAYLALQDALFARLGKRTDEGKGVFTSIKAFRKVALDRKKETARQQRARAFGRAVFGREGPAEVRVGPSDKGSPSGVSVKGRRIVVDEALVVRIPARHRELFLASCGLIENMLGARTGAAARRLLFEQLAAVFASFGA